jgi:O-methyltransferase involved in polyketide biosynthesis
MESTKEVQDRLSSEKKSMSQKNTPTNLKFTALIVLYGKYIAASLERFWRKENSQGKVTTTKEDLLYREDLLKHLKNGLIPPEMEKQFQGFKPRTWGVFVVRRLEFIAMIHEAIADGFTQFISLASGADPLLEEILAEVEKNNPNIRCFEMDFPEMITSKKTLLKEIIKPKVVYKKGDITKDFDKFFQAKKPERIVQKDKPVLFLLEGIMPYLDRNFENKIDHGVDLLKKIDATFTGEIRICMDSLNTEGINDIQSALPKTEEAIKEMKKQGIYINTSYDNLQKELADKTGFKVDQKKHKTLCDITQSEGLGDNPFYAQKNHSIDMMHRAAKSKIAEKVITKEVESTKQVQFK